MIKDITHFPRLDMLQQYSNLKEIDRLCSDGIREMEITLEQLRMELNTAVLECEQDNIVEQIVACNIHMSVCESSKLMIEGDLNALSFLYN